MKNNIKFIHVGFPKCGSTFLQSEVFDKIKAINAITVGGKNCAMPSILSYITYCQDPYYDQKQVSKELKDIPNDINGISNEGFTSFVSPVLLAKRLKKSFGDIKILIVLRNQKSILLSHYLHDIKIGYVASFDKWLDIQFANFRYKFFQYSHSIECYQKQFGVDNVKVVLFEELFNREKITEILEFTEFPTDGIEDINYNLKVNAAHSPLSLRLNRLLNCHFGTKANHGAGYVYGLYRYRLASKIDKINSFLGGKKKANHFNDHILNKIKECYHDDNQKLNTIMNRDLSEKGYL